MTADTKTQLEHVQDVVNQLKEMHHYAKNNTERLTAQWLLFDGELKKLKQADRIEGLMTRQSELYDALGTDIAALEELVVELTPAEEDATAPTQN
jgi:protein-disulfide isomerase